MMAVVNKARQHIVVTIAITIAILAGGAAGAVQLWGILDRTHTTEAELLLYDLKAHTFATKQFDELKLEMTENDTVGKCRWLKSEIRALADSIYVRKRDSADPELIRELETDLSELRADYLALVCALKLSI